MAEGRVLFVRGDKGQNTQSDSTAPEDDMWDDTELVKAYDRAINLAKEEVVRRMGLIKETAQEGNVSQKSKKKKNGKKETLKLENGAACCARYSGDGVWYEATIMAVLPETQSYIVKYIGYNNEEEVHQNQLKPSRGKAARKRQEFEATCQDTNFLQNGVDMECSEGEFGRETKPKVETTSKSPRGNRMEWESRSAPPLAPPLVPPLNGGFMPQMRPLRLPPMGVPPMIVAPPPPPHLTSSFPEEDAEALSAMLMSWYMSGFHTGYYQGLKQGRNSQNDRNSSRGSSRK